MKKDNKDIKNESAYFYKVVKNMNMKDQIKRTIIEKHEVLMGEFLCEEFFVDEQILNKNLIGWIELIENSKLHKAVSNLDIEEQIFISYIVKENMTQRELAEIYSVAHQNINKKFNNIVDKLRGYFD